MTQAERADRQALRPQRLVLENVGHLPNLERPARFNAELAALLDRTAPRS